MDQSVEFSHWNSRSALKAAQRADRIAHVVVLAMLVAFLWRFV